MEEKNFIIEELKESTPENAEAIRQLTKQLGDNFNPLTDEDFAEMLNSPINHLFVTKEQTTNKIVGMITVLIYRIPYAKKAYIDDFVVDIAYRHHGLGRELFEKAVAYAKAQRVAYIQFTSRKDRTKSNEFYQKMGFQIHDTNVYRLNLSYDEE